MAPQDEFFYAVAICDRSACAFDIAIYEVIHLTQNKKPIPFWRIGLSSIPKVLSKFHPPPEFAPLYQKNNTISITHHFNNLNSNLHQGVSKVFKQGCNGERVQGVWGETYCKVLDLKRVM